MLTFHLTENPRWQDLKQIARELKNKKWSRLLKYLLEMIEKWKKLLELGNLDM